MDGKAKLEVFEALYGGLADDVLDHVKRYDLPEDGLKWFREVSRYPPFISPAPPSFHAH